MSVYEEKERKKERKKREKGRKRKRKKERKREGGGKMREIRDCFEST